MTFDMDAADAERVEAAGGRFEFKHRGELFTLPCEFSLDMVEALAALPSQDSVPGLRAMLTALLEDQAERCAVGAMSGQGLKRLFDEYFQHTGVRLGESEPSPSSSESTARPSKRTSKRSTASTSTKPKARSAGGASRS